ncbi:type VII secretion target [Actinokineospora iranica]|uniref:Excreted virulence factor EspC, type VII ESX diderm n=1 Tax=Actinokineospora iranica TaxID=1271860 RepID=A0A1G6TJ86_9PSEU|nr:type VII secretion target [Actinokineospora iranica]SDD28924.1 Excreted virulence factor EspC, type VII ESX diderm [Actinokineospora iranica]
MGSGFDVDVAAVRVHAHTVATISTRVGSATGSARSVSDGAYGLIGQFFATAITGACGDVLDGVRKVATAVDDVRAGLETVAREYERTDAGNAATFAGREAGA